MRHPILIVTAGERIRPVPAAIGRGVHALRYEQDQGWRMRPKLRLFTGDDDGGLALEEPTVPMNFGEFTRLVADAGRFDRTWLTDFHEEEIRVPEDLYQVLTAYRLLRPGA